MAYFLLLLSLFFLAALAHERDMPGNGFARFCGVVFAAFFMAAWIASCSAVGYILLG
jgi:hypothetical protein